MHAQGCASRTARAAPRFARWSTNRLLNHLWPSRAVRLPPLFFPGIFCPSILLTLSFFCYFKCQRYVTLRAREWVRPRERSSSVVLHIRPIHLNAPVDALSDYRHAYMYRTLQRSDVQAGDACLSKSRRGISYFCSGKSVAPVSEAAKGELRTIDRVLLFSSADDHGSATSPARDGVHSACVSFYLPRIPPLVCRTHCCNRDIRRFLTFAVASSAQHQRILLSRLDQVHRAIVSR